MREGEQSGVAEISCPVLAVWSENIRSQLIQYVSGTVLYLLCRHVWITEDYKDMSSIMADQQRPRI